MLTSRGLWALAAAYSLTALSTAFFVYPPLILSLLTTTVFLAVYIVQAFRRMASISQEKISVERQVSPPAVSVGQTVDVVLQLSSRLDEGVEVEVEDVFEGLVLVEGSPTTYAVLEPGGSLTLRYRLKAEKRGEYTVGPAVVRIYDGPRLVVRKMVAGKPVRILASPALETRLKLGESIIRSRDGVGGSGLNPLTGADEVFRQVKPYTEGEPVRRIAWRRTARSMEDEILVKQYEHFSSVGIGLILDCSPSMAVGSLLDRCLATVLFLTSAFLRKGDTVHVKTLGAADNISLRATSYSSHYMEVLSKVSKIRPGGFYTPPEKLDELRDLDLIFILSRFAYWSGGELATLLKNLSTSGASVLPICPVKSPRPEPLFTTLARLEEARIRHLREKVPQIQVFPEHVLLPQMLNLYRLYSGRPRHVKYL